MRPAVKSEGQSLADMIMAKLASGDYEERTETQDEEIDMDNIVEMGGGKSKGNKKDGAAQIRDDENNYDPKVVATYKKVGVFMKTFRSGKLPMVFKVIPMLPNWEEVLFMTNPSGWSPNATYEATRIFASNLKDSMARRFYSLILLDAVRENIAKYKKLNCHLYMAVKKSIFKTSAFF